MKRLAAVEKEIQSEGDLRGVLAVKKEKEAIEKTGKPLADPPEGEPAALEESRAVYPAYVDTTTEWMPVWNDKITGRSDAGIGSPTSEPMPELRLRGGKGRIGKTAHHDLSRHPAWVLDRATEASEVAVAGHGIAKIDDLRNYVS